VLHKEASLHNVTCEVLAVSSGDTTLYEQVHKEQQSR
jgi:hypothetical protein